MDLILFLDLGMVQQAGYGAGQPLGVGGESMAMWKAAAIKVQMRAIQSAICSCLLTAGKMIFLDLQAM